MNVNVKFVILCDPDSLPKDAKKYSFIYGDIKHIDLNQFNQLHTNKLGLLIKYLSEVKI